MDHLGQTEESEGAGFESTSRMMTARVVVAAVHDSLRIPSRRIGLPGQSSGS